VIVLKENIIILYRDTLKIKYTVDSWTPW
jgi:hypothetical protein